MSFLMMKAQVYNPVKHIISPQWYISEKLDGRYFFWDGGSTTGLPAKDVPWANTLKDKREFISTGMWSSQGKVVNIPEQLASNLPPYLLEGELWGGRGQFQATMSATKRYNGTDESWDNISLMLFGAPTVNEFTQRRTIKYLAGDVDVTIDSEILSDMRDIYSERKYSRNFQGYIKWCSDQVFTDRIKAVSYKTIESVMKENNFLDIKSTINHLLNAVLSIQGEGLILRAPWNYWQPIRSNDILKVKPFKDAEGTIVGYMTGKETDKGSTLLGKIGAYVISSRNLDTKPLDTKPLDTEPLDTEPVTFELSGMEHSLRELPPDAKTWALEHSNEQLPENFHLSLKDYNYAIGKQVTFRYRELSNDGLPKEARFLRFRED